MHFILPDDRSQLTFYGKLDDLVAEDHPVRLLDLIVNQIVNSNIEKFTQKGQSEIGRKAFHPGTLSKLYLYGYCNGISSSRKLEVECYRNIELIWLMGNLKPDHKTIADYRKDHEQEIKFVALEFRRFLKENGYISGKTISLDGTKIKANANRDMLSLEKIENRLEDLQAKLDQYLKKLNANDLEDDLLDEIDDIPEKESKEFLINKIIQLEKQVEELAKSKEILLTQKTKAISLSDPDARLMKSRDGKIPGYNAEVAVDTKNKLIVLAEVTNKQADQDQLKPSVDCLTEQLGIKPKQVIADKGFFNVVQIQEIEKDGQTTCYVPPEKSSTKESDKLFNINFTFDPQKGEYTCSQGKSLVLTGRNIKKGKRIADRYSGTGCLGCSMRAKCTRSKKGRILYRYKDEEWVEEYKKRMRSPFSKKMSALRKESSEHVFGTIKYWMGKIPLLVRGRTKVQVEMDLYATSYNFKRLINLNSMEYLLAEVKNYNWKAL